MGRLHVSLAALACAGLAGCVPAPSVTPDAGVSEASAETSSHGLEWPALVSSAAAADAPPQLEQFGRLVGVWGCTSEARQPDGTFQPGAAEATWTWFYTLGGHAVQDLFEPVAGPVGTNLRVYDPETDSWDIQWVTGALTEFERITAKVTAEAIVMHGEAPASPPFPQHRRRITFSEISADRFEWKYEATKPGGDTGWVEYSRLHCTRRGDLPS